MLIKVLFFIMDNISLLILGVILIIIVYYWISFFKNKDYKFVYEKKIKYKNGDLTNKDLEIIKHQIECMEGREFEYFCEWLFRNIGSYTSVKLTPAENDEGKDLILIDKNNETVFVECKRYTNNATVTEDFMIGREICQKLTGALVADGISKGIIITTGNIHKNAWDYIVKLEKNSNIKIEIITLDEIIRMVKVINNSEVFRIVGCSLSE